MRKVSQAGLELIKKWEGLRLKAYKDVGGVWTIGYGHTSAAGDPHVSRGMRITAERAEDILKHDLRRYESFVEQNVIVALNDCQFAALVSFCYNVGEQAFLRSNLLRKLNEGDYACVPLELQKWNKVHGVLVEGLSNRRCAEAGLWVTEAYIASNYQAVDTGRSGGKLKMEAIAPIIASLSGLGSLFVDNKPLQYAMSAVVVAAAAVVLYLILQRYKQDKQ